MQAILPQLKGSMYKDFSQKIIDENKTEENNKSNTTNMTNRTNNIKKEILGKCLQLLTNQEGNNGILKILNYLYKEKYNHLNYIFQNFDKDIFRKEVETTIDKHKDEIEINRHDCCLNSEGNVFNFCFCIDRNEQTKYKCDNTKCYCNFRQGYFFFVEKNESYVFNTKLFYRQLTLKIENVLHKIFNMIYNNEMSINNFLIFRKVKLGTYVGELQNLKRKVPLPPQAIVAKKMKQIFKNFAISYKEKMPFVVVKKLKNEKMYTSVCHPFFLKGIFKSFSNVFKNYDEFFQHLLEKRSYRIQYLEQEKMQEMKKISEKNLSRNEMKEQNEVVTENEKNKIFYDVIEKTEEDVTEEENVTEEEEEESCSNYMEDEEETSEERERREVKKYKQNELQIDMNISNTQQHLKCNNENTNHNILSYKNEIKKLKQLNYEYYIVNATLPPLKRMLDLLPYYTIDLEKIFYNTKRRYNLNKFNWERFRKNKESNKYKIWNNENCDMEEQLEQPTRLTESTKIINDSNQAHKRTEIRLQMQIDAYKEHKTEREKQKEKLIEREKQKEKKKQKKILKSYFLINKYQTEMKKLNHLCLACAHSEIKALGCSYAIHCPVYMKKLNLEEQISKYEEITNRQKI